MKIKPIPQCCGKPMVTRMDNPKGINPFYFQCLRCGKIIDYEDNR